MNSEQAQCYTTQYWEENKQQRQAIVAEHLVGFEQDKETWNAWAKEYEQALKICNNRWVN